MKVSLNSIRQFIDFELPPIDELVAKINAQLGQIEQVEDLADKYKDVIIVKVVSTEKHPNADRLTVCLVDDGGVAHDVERTHEGWIRVVCGAPNAREGIFAAWLPPRATVPSTYGEAEPFVLDARELRGVRSNGMLAAVDELALGTDHAGILEIDENEWHPSDVAVAPGASFAKVFGLDDTILEIENKMFTHRPDLFGQIGVAREIAGILGQQFKSPEWYMKQPTPGSGEGLKLTVVNEADEKCARFMAVAIKDVQVRPSPLWLQIELIRLGGKPINNIVDATNYVMLLTAQPTHAYDYDKLRGNTLGVRMARTDEKCVLLNGKSYTLTTEDVVIVDGEGVVGLGGVMGGENSEVSSETTNIVLEVATFDMYTIRKTSMRHGLFTDAVTRFNKGQSSLQNDRILNLLMMSIRDIAGGTTASGISDLYIQPAQEVSLAYDADFINQRLGSELSAQDIKEHLERVEFHVDVGYGLKETTTIEDAAGNKITAASEVKDPYTVRVPFWRTDIEQREDIVEEIGRLYGFDKLPRVLPMRSTAPAPEHEGRVLKQKVRVALQKAGANEIVSYSFVHEKLLINAGQQVSHAYQLSNALSPDLQYYRLSVLPSLLDKVHMNIKAGFDAFALFEIGKAHSKDLGLNEEGVPKETEQLGLVIANKREQAGAPFFEAAHLLSFILKSVGVEVTYTPIDTTIDDDGRAMFEPTRSAICSTKEGLELGIVGELRSEVRTSFKLPEYTAAAHISIDALLEAVTTAHSKYVVLSRYPSISRDISLRSDSGLSYQHLYGAVTNAIQEYRDKFEVTIEPTAIYRAAEDSSHKTTTFHLEFTSSERTLTDTDIAPIIDSVSSTVNESTAAELI